MQFDVSKPKFEKMKKLSREEMKNVMGGYFPKEDTYRCCVGTSTTDCAALNTCTPHTSCTAGNNAVKC